MNTNHILIVLLYGTVLYASGELRDTLGIPKGCKMLARGKRSAAPGMPQRRKPAP